MTKKLTEREKTSIYNREYKRSFKGKATRMWNDINKRVKKYRSYDVIELRMTREEFFEYILNDPAYKKYHAAWVKSGYELKVSPSVDRIDPHGHYEIGNIRVLPTHVNVSRTRRRPSRPRGFKQVTKK